MPVSTTSNKAGPYSCNGSQTIFPFTFPIFGESDLEVILRDADGNETILTYGSHYLVTKSGASWENGGNVTTITTYPSGKTITIRRVLAVTQETDYVENDPFPAELHENDHDKITMIAQQIKERADRALVFPISDPASSIGELSSVIQRKGLYLMFDAVSGKPVCVTNIIPGTVTITDFAKTVLDDPNASTARATLDVPSNAEAILDSLLTADGDAIIRSGGVPARFDASIAFSAHPVAVQSIPSATWTKMLNATEEVDIGADYDVSLSRFIAPVAGTYLFSASINLAQVDIGRLVRVSLYKNGTQVYVIGSIEVVSVSNYNHCTGQRMMQLAANDYVELYVQNTDTVSRDTSIYDAYCWFSGFRIFAGI
jgi:hypothetical protein